MRHIESQIQQSCMRWFGYQYYELTPVCFAVPNGGARNKREAAIMKGEGVTAGVADVLLLVARNGYHGLCIEFKTEDGKQSKSQKEWQKAVTEQGYLYVVVRSFDEFKSVIENYLGAKS